MWEQREQMRAVTEKLRDLGQLLGRYRREIACLLGGVICSAGRAMGSLQPLALGWVLAMEPGWETIFAALGALLGYGLVWREPGAEGMAWILSGVMAVGLTARSRGNPLLLPALAALILSGDGVLGQRLWGIYPELSLFFLRLGLGMGSAALFARWREEKPGWSRWLVQLLGVGCLTGLPGLRYLDPGCIAAGMLGAAGGFPSAVLGGLGLDLAGVGPGNLTAALTAGYLLRLIPSMPWLGCLGPGAGFLLLGVLGDWEPEPLPALILGGALAGMFPAVGKYLAVSPKTGEAAMAQVRLEQMALALEQMARQLEAVEEIPADVPALLGRARAEACDGCPRRRDCGGRQAELPLDLLSQPGLSQEDVPRDCRRPGRYLQALRRSQEQLRRIRADQSRRKCCRVAALEQYEFLSSFLRGLSDDLARRRQHRPDRFHPRVYRAGRSAGAVSGDTCLWFHGSGNQYYVLLCDGMGTGAEAAAESRQGAALLRQMLLAGLSPEAALRSFNSLTILRELGGCTTVDLLALGLDTGRGTLYKWGAAGSCLLRRDRIRCWGTPMPPPGLSQQQREQSCRVSLRRGEILLLHSDGVQDGCLLELPREAWTAETLADWVIAHAGPEDDATAVGITLCPVEDRRGTDGFFPRRSRSAEAPERRYSPARSDSPSATPVISRSGSDFLPEAAPEK